MFDGAPCMMLLVQYTHHQSHNSVLPVAKVLSCLITHRLIVVMSIDVYDNIVQLKINLEYIYPQYTDSRYGSWASSCF